MLNAAIIGVSGFGITHLNDLFREHEAGRLNFIAAVIHQNQVSPENLERIKALNVEIFEDYQFTPHALGKDRVTCRMG